MKVQVLILDIMEESVSFFNELDMKRELCSSSVLFFNELETKNKHCLRWFVSFLHKLETENNYACGDLFHFYTSLKQKVTMLEDIHFIFNELDIEWELCSPTCFIF